MTMNWRYIEIRRVKISLTINRTDWYLGSKEDRPLEKKIERSWNDFNKSTNGFNDLSP